MKKVTILAAAVLLTVFLFIFSTGAAENDIKVLLNGQEISLTASPVIENGRTLVPFRSIFEAVGFSVHWDPMFHIVTGSGSETYILLAIGSTTAIVNGNPVLLDVPPVIKDGYTMVPLRFIAEAAGYQVDWNEENRQVLINDWTSDSPDYRPLWAQITANSGYLTSIDAQFDVNVRFKQFNNSPVPALPLNLHGNITMSAKEDENLLLAMDMKSTFANFFPYTDVKIYIKDGYFYINYYSGNQNIKTKISLPDLSNNNLISIMYVDFSTSKNNINALQPLTSTQFDHYVKQLFMESDVPNAKITLTFDGSALSSRLKRYFVPAISLNDIQCILTTDENNHLQTIIFETAGTIKNDPYVNISAELNGSVLIKAYGEDQVEVKFPSDLDTYELINRPHLWGFWY